MTIVRTPPVMIHPITESDEDVVPWSIADYRIKEHGAKFGHGNGVRVGVCDTGLDKVHAETTFAGRIYKARSFTGESWHDSHFHGTHVAGIIGSKIGVAENAELVIAKVLGNSGSGTDVSVAEGLKWCADQGCHVICASLGSATPSPAIQEACEYLHKHNVILAAATGNEGAPRGSYPAAFTTLATGVGAIDQGRNLAPFSNRGEAVDLVGPGVRILSLGLYGRKQMASGTSMATPWIAGLVALRIGAELATTNQPQLDAATLEAFLDSGVVNDLGRSGRDSDYGRGVPDVAKWLDIEAEKPKSRELIAGLFRTADNKLELQIGKEIVRNIPG